MATEFGKMLRKIRIGCDEYLKDMADKLNVSSAYLSAVENGKRNVTEQIIEKIFSEYHLTKDELEELKRLSAISNKTVQLNIANSPMSKRDLAVAFARRFDTIDDEQAKRIKEILSEE